MTIDPAWHATADALAALSIAGLLLALIAQLGVRLTYPLLRPRLLRWPAQRQVQALSTLLLFPLLLVLAVLPALLAPAWLPAADPEHCHAQTGCAAHVPITLPTIGIAALAMLGVVLLLAGGLLLGAARSSRRVQRLLAGLGRQSDARGFLRLQTPAPLALSVGLWRPRIALSEGLLAEISARDLAVVLAHEAAHGRHHDNLRVLVLGLVFPLARGSSLWSDWLQALELRADAAARREVGSGLAVAEALLRLHRLLPAPVRGDARAFGGHTLRHRLDMLFQTPPADAGRGWALPALALGIAALALALAPFHWLVEQLALRL